MHKDFNVSAKAVDDDDAIKLNYKSLRGNGGIAVFWKKTIDNAVKIKSYTSYYNQQCTDNVMHSKSLHAIRYQGGRL